MRVSSSAKFLLATALLLLPVSAFTQSGGGGGGGGGGSAGGSSGGAASSGGTRSGGSATGAVTAAPNAGAPGAGSTAINGVTGPANPAGVFNTGNDPSGLGNAPSNAQNRPGTNSAGTANSRIPGHGWRRHCTPRLDYSRHDGQPSRRCNWRPDRRDSYARTCPAGRQRDQGGGRSKLKGRQENQRYLPGMLKGASSYVALVIALASISNASARTDHHRIAKQRAPKTAGVPVGSIPAEKSRDPADVARDRRIKSICRGC